MALALALTLALLALLPLPLVVARLLPLTLLALAPLAGLRPLFRALLQRVEIAGEPPRAIERLILLVARLALTESRLRFVEPAPHVVDAARDVAFHRVDVVLRPAAADERLREAHLVAQPVVTHRSGRLRELARGRLFVARRIARRAIE